MTRVVVIGDLMTDVVARAELALARGSATPARVHTYGGGSGANVAAWLGVCDVDVALIGRRGSDINGRTREMELMGYGIDARMVMDQDRPTGTCVVMVTHKGQRTMLTDPAANAAFSPEDIPTDLFSPDAHLHVSGYTMLNEGSRDAALAALDLARRAGMSVSVDGASASPLKRAGAESFLEWSQGTQLLFVDDDEAEVLTGREEPGAAAKVLTAWYPQVVVKVGMEGALWCANGHTEPISVPHAPIDRNVDGTGAGDAFVAGFLPTWLAGKAPAEALTAGTVLAARAYANIGARPDLGET